MCCICDREDFVEGTAQLELVVNEFAVKTGKVGGICEGTLAIKIAMSFSVPFFFFPLLFSLLDRLESCSMRLL
jgi:hypothetical protein